jgi:hypothetical protein
MKKYEVTKEQLEVEPPEPTKRGPKKRSKKVPVVLQAKRDEMEVKTERADKLDAMNKIYKEKQEQEAEDLKRQSEAIEKLTQMEKNNN